MVAFKAHSHGIIPQESQSTLCIIRQVVVLPSDDLSESVKSYVKEWSGCGCLRLTILLRFSDQTANKEVFEFLQSVFQISIKNKNKMKQTTKITHSYSNMYDIYRKGSYMLLDKRNMNTGLGHQHTVSL